MYNNYIIQKDLQYIISQNVEYERLKNKSILITGANGMLASYYLYTLMYLNDKKNMNIKIYPLVRNIKKLEKNIDFNNRVDIKPIIQDICEPIMIKDKIDFVIHMASLADPQSITSCPVEIIKANVIGTLNVLEFAKKNSAKVIFTSTREVYGKVENKMEIDENDMGVLNHIELRSCYPESKRMAENLLISYSYEYDVNFEIARIAHSYGPGMKIKNDGRIMSDLICNVYNNENIILKSTGEAKRAFCYVADTTVAMFLITLAKTKNQIYNVSNETEEIKIKDLAESLANKWYKEKNIKVEYKIEDKGNKYLKYSRVKLNNNKIMNELNWKPKISLRDGIDSTIRYLEEEDKLKNKSY